MTSGSAHGVGDDAGPAVHRIPGESIFSLAAAAGRGWATYAESMPTACDREPASPYATKHNPALYYLNLYATCRSNDLPLGTTARGPLAAALAGRTLPAYSLVVPDLCDDTHDCPVAVGDRWLARWVAAITSSPTYADGRTALFVTWDEDDSSHGNRVLLIFVAPPIRPGTVVTGAFDHPSLLRTTEELLGLPVALASAAPSMRGAAGM